ncbi:hypothetical protein N7512_007863 [Penicillium capsulatum]|nr:hypothetical protein N7512_007863 [Penicillium capsulatum]
MTAKVLNMMIPNGFGHLAGSHFPAVVRLTSILHPTLQSLPTKRCLAIERRMERPQQIHRRVSLTHRPGCIIVL